LGGESSGKTILGQALHHGLNAMGLLTVLVPEHLRAWCASRGRAPEAHEQETIASEQTRLIEQAAATPGVQVVLADTSALQIAVYSELYFSDPSLYPQALEWQRRAGMTLLMGLDLPWVADGLLRDGPLVREATDTALRRELQNAGLPYYTVYGQGDARVRCALRAIGSALGRSLVPDAAGWSAGRRVWGCERCGDADCEHRLFTQLVPPRAE
jgi:HTH-type transcriptional regulator, transcriptional repressor of NAD biosynthesis genes